MCGIAGHLELDCDRRANGDVLAAMLRAIRHRGPDDEGCLVDRELAIGMRRLSIIDLESGGQPIFDESGRYGVVFNGEIYNYRELRADLERRGHRFATQSDTEVIVHLYEESGADCLHQLRGMFALAVWDNQDRRLFLARDRLGIKPLYYTQMGDSLIFGSEIKAILAHPAVSAELDIHALSDYLSLKYVPAPRTLFAGIESLPPGHTLTCHRGRVDVRRYWDVEFSADTSNLREEEQVERLRSLLEECVRLHLRSDVPFGAFLSGGLDSSVVVALMSQMLDEPVKTFSVGFHSNSEMDERPYARQVARRFGADHHEIVVGPSDFVDLADRVLSSLDQPIADQATIATYMVSELAAGHVKMVLTGEGGDELFAGYARYAVDRYSAWSRRLPEAAGALVRRSLPLLPGLRRPKIAAYALSIRDEAQRLANWLPMCNRDQKQRVLSRELRARLNGHETHDVIARHLGNCRSGHQVNRMLYVDTKLWLPDYLLLRGDKLSMAHSLEARVPLLDHKLVEFAAALPPSLKIRGRVRKYLLKQVARRLLPDEIIHRPKQGFPIPIHEWLRGEARELLHDLLSPDSLRRRGLFDAEYVGTLMRQHDSGFADHCDQLWGLVSVEMWCRSFVDNSRRSVHATEHPAAV